MLLAILVVMCLICWSAGKGISWVGHNPPRSWFPGTSRASDTVEQQDMDTDLSLTWTALDDHQLIRLLNESSP